MVSRKQDVLSRNKWVHFPLNIFVCKWAYESFSSLHYFKCFRLYMIISRHPNSGQNQNIRTANESFEKVTKFKYLGTTLTNQNDIHDEIKSRLNSGNAYYHSVQNLLSSRLISKNLKIKIYKTVILPVALYGCETWSLTLREEHRLAECF
jgi:hypothetical protein